MLDRCDASLYLNGGPSSPRTPPSHGGNTGSNPVGDANDINELRDHCDGLYKICRIYGLVRGYAQMCAKPVPQLQAWSNYVATLLDPDSAKANVIPLSAGTASGMTG